MCISSWNGLFGMVCSFDLHTDTSTARICLCEWRSTRIGKCSRLYLYLFVWLVSCRWAYSCEFFVDCVIDRVTSLTTSQWSQEGEDEEEEQVHSSWHVSKVQLHCCFKWVSELHQTSTFARRVYSTWVLYLSILFSPIVTHCTCCFFLAPLSLFLSEGELVTCNSSLAAVTIHQCDRMREKERVSHLQGERKKFLKFLGN